VGKKVTKTVSFLCWVVRETFNQSINQSIIHSFIQSMNQFNDHVSVHGLSDHRRVLSLLPGKVDRPRRDSPITSQRICAELVPYSVVCLLAKLFCASSLLNFRKFFRHPTTVIFTA